MTSCKERVRDFVIQGIGGWGGGQKWADAKKNQVLIPRTYIDGSFAVDCINCSIVTPVSRQMQSDGY